MQLLAARASGDPGSTYFSMQPNYIGSGWLESQLRECSVGGSINLDMCRLKYAVTG